MKKKDNKIKYLFFLIFICIFLILTNSVSSEDNLVSDMDDDGVSDIYEDFFGSNSNDSSDVKKVIISDSNYYLIDINEDNKSDIFFDGSICRYNNIKEIDGLLHIDSNFDSEWDYTYDNSLEPIQKNSIDILWLIIIGIIISVLIIILILFKTGILYLYEEEYVYEE